MSLPLYVRAQEMDSHILTLKPLLRAPTKAERRGGLLGLMASEAACEVRSSVMLYVGSLLRG